MTNDHPSLAEVQTTTLFKEMILSYIWPNSDTLNEKLSDTILSREKLEPVSIQASNVGGWHSGKSLQEWSEPCIQTILDRITAFSQIMTTMFVGQTASEFHSGWTIEAWANVNRTGNFHKYHHHFRNANIWSGVYYADIGTQLLETSANIIFSQLHMISIKGHVEFSQEHRVAPSNSLMLLFPSSLGHRVETHQGTRPRITIAFNLKHPLFTTTKYELAH